MLLRFDAGVARGFFAKAEKASNGVAEVVERGVVAVGDGLFHGYHLSRNRCDVPDRSERSRRFWPATFACCRSAASRRRGRYFTVMVPVISAGWMSQRNW